MEWINVFTPGERVLAAVSGGSDSVALLLLLAEARDRGEIEMVAAHYQHGMRASAERDAAFVAALCRKLDVRLIVGRGDVPAYQRETHMGAEEAARSLRYRFLRETMRAENANVIATAHHALDQAETVLMHLLRGSGLRGACGMAARSNDLARPLIACDKAELLAYLASRGQEYCTDETNMRPDNPRNRIRLEALPLLRGIYPGCDRALCRFAENARADDALLQRMTRDWAKAHVSRMAFGWRLRADAVEEAILRRALACVLANARDVERAADMYRAREARCSLEGYALERTGEALYLIARGAHAPEAIVPVCDGARIEGLGVLRMTKAAPEPIRENGFRQVLNADALTGAVLRTRRDGDWMTPLGMTGAKKCSDILIDRKIDRPLRDWIPVVAKGSEVLWMAGVMIARDARVTPDTNAVLCTWEDERYGEAGLDGRFGESAPDAGDDSYAR